MNKNLNYEFWMSICNKFANASTCRVKIGTILVKNNYIVGTGYLGSLSGDNHCCDNECLFVDNNGMFGSSNTGKSCIRTVHSETNAVLKCFERDDIICYTTYEPCLSCLKLLLSIGAYTIVYEKSYTDKYRDIYIDNLHENLKNKLSIIQYNE